MIRFFANTKGKIEQATPRVTRLPDGEPLVIGYIESFEQATPKVTRQHMAGQQRRDSRSILPLCIVV
jgi:hypothetical protein